MRSRYLLLLVTPVTILLTYMLTSHLLSSLEFSLDSYSLLLKEDHYLKVFYYPALMAIYWMWELFTSDMWPNGAYLALLIPIASVVGIVFGVLRYLKSKKLIWVFMYGISLILYMFMGIIITGIENGC
ncbi:hypothetical protein [Spirochaeta cellobiosiphila]|uniref:hypothetical protein n=1 Tax=Spirochaeta cellobiosiphila TaxID=504483 RepID=UPI00048B8E10|nr:hypothetical protein [Spirochaeta cellobiosiphila]